jgi:hypothetical protein
MHGICQPFKPSDSELRVEVVRPLPIRAQFARVDMPRIVPGQVGCFDGSNGSIEGLTACSLPGLTASSPRVEEGADRHADEREHWNDPRYEPVQVLLQFH